MSQYLLPCECGKSVGVKPPQAGESVRCDCGKSLTVPDLRNLRELPRLESATAEKKNSWTPVRGAIFGIGFATFLVGAGCLAMFGYKYSQLHLTPPDMNKVKQFQVDLAKITPTQAWDLWADVEQRTLYRFRAPLYLQDRARAVWLNKLMSFAGGVCVVGLITAFGSTFVGRRR